MWAASDDDNADAFVAQAAFTPPAFDTGEVLGTIIHDHAAPPMLPMTMEV